MTDICTIFTSGRAALTKDMFFDRYHSFHEANGIARFTVNKTDLESVLSDLTLLHIEYMIEEKRDEVRHYWVSCEGYSDDPDDRRRSFNFRMENGDYVGLTASEEFVIKTKFIQ